MFNSNEKNALSSPGKSDSDTINRLCATQTKKKEKQFFHQGTQIPIRLKFNSDLKKKKKKKHFFPPGNSDSILKPKNLPKSPKFPEDIIDSKFRPLRSRFE